MTDTPNPSAVAEAVEVRQWLLDAVLDLGHTAIDRGCQSCGLAQNGLTRAVDLIDTLLADRQASARREEELRAELLDREEERRFWTALKERAPEGTSTFVTDYERELYSLWRYAERTSDTWRGIAAAMGYEPNAHRGVRPKEAWLKERIQRFREMVAHQALRPHEDGVAG